MKILSVLLEITPNLATRAIETPLSSPKGTMWCLCDPTPSGWCKMDAHSMERTRLYLFQFSFRDQAINWIERLPTGFISTWEDLTTRFLAHFFPPGRTAKLQNDILMFQQRQGRNLANGEEWRPVCADKKYNASTTTRAITSGRIRRSRSDFMQLSLEVVEKLKEEIRVKKNKFMKIKKIMRKFKASKFPTSLHHLRYNTAMILEEVKSDYRNPDGGRTFRP
ncbi:zinc finger, CCHC-type containing protein [Tanacetum coccineum]